MFRSGTVMDRIDEDIRLYVILGMLFCISEDEIVAPESPSSLLSSACCFIIAEDENVTRGCLSSMLCFAYCLYFY